MSIGLSAIALATVGVHPWFSYPFGLEPEQNDSILPRGFHSWDFYIQPSTMPPLLSALLPKDAPRTIVEDMKGEMPVMDAAEAQQEFSKLVEDQTTCCLWFMREPQKISVMDPSADTVLKTIVRHGTRPAWRRAKELQAWRCHNIK